MLFSEQASNNEQGSKDYESNYVQNNSQRGLNKRNSKNNKKKVKLDKNDYNKRPSKALKRAGLILLVLGILVALMTVSLLALDYFGVISIDNIKQGLFGEKRPSIELSGNVLDDSSYRVESPDADQYFRENSTIIKEVDANQADDVQTEQSAISDYSDRGFNEFPIVAEYSMDGKLLEETEVSRQSAEKHPMYQLYYQAATGDFWTVFLIDGSVSAYPVTYNLKSKHAAELIITESDTVISYDSKKNKFYETVPKESELIVKKVDKINKDTLDILTVEAIEEL